MSLTISTVDNAAEFAVLRVEWGELLAASDSDCLFLTWEWLYMWWIHVGRHRSLSIIAVRSRSRLVAIVPLTATRAWIGPVAFPIFEFAGSGTVGSDYLDWVVRRGFESEVVDAVSQFLNDASASLRLSRIAAESSIATLLAPRLTQQGWMSVTSANDVCPFIDLSEGSWDRYLQTVGSSHRYNIKRRIRNLMRDHDVVIEYPQTDEERRAALECVIRLHLQRWAGRGGSDAFDDEDIIRFHHEFTALAQKRGWLRLMVLYVDGRAAAAFYGFRYGRTFSFYQSGFDAAFVSSSVGLVMIAMTVQDAIREGATEYDFLHGDESYKFLWTKTVKQLLRLELYPPGRLGRMHHNAARVTAATKQLAKRVLRYDNTRPLP